MNTSLLGTPSLMQASMYSRMLSYPDALSLSAPEGSWSAPAGAKE